MVKFGEFRILKFKEEKVTHFKFELNFFQKSEFFWLVCGFFLCLLNWFEVFLKVRRQTRIYDLSFYYFFLFYTNFEGFRVFFFQVLPLKYLTYVLLLRFFTKLTLFCCLLGTFWHLRRTFRYLLRTFGVFIGLLLPFWCLRLFVFLLI